MDFEGYEVLSSLSHGGTGDVLLARRRGVHGFDKLVAIKTINASSRELQARRAAFLDEARVLSQLEHPSVAQLVDFGQADDVPYLVMEYVSGVPVGKVLNGPWPSLAAAEVIAETCRALHAAHSLKDLTDQPLNVVHRDVRPQNILLGFNGHVKVIDFGIALMRDRATASTEAGQVKGNLWYVSPEQLFGEPVDARSDVFSAGVVLYELLTGRRPFSGDNPLALGKAITAGAPPPPSSHSARIPPLLDSIVLQALERSRDDRFSSAKKMAAALRDFVANAGGYDLEDFAREELEVERDENRQWIRALLREGPEVHSFAAIEATRPEPRESTKTVKAFAPTEDTATVTAPHPTPIDPMRTKPDGAGLSADTVVNATVPTAAEPTQPINPLDLEVVKADILDAEGEPLIEDSGPGSIADAGDGSIPAAGPGSLADDADASTPAAETLDDDSSEMPSPRPTLELWEPVKPDTTGPAQAPTAAVNQPKTRIIAAVAAGVMTVLVLVLVILLSGDGDDPLDEPSPAETGSPAQTDSEHTTSAKGLARDARLAMSHAMSEKGVARGDSPPLDALRRLSTDAFREDRFEVSRETAEEASELIKKIDIDRGFVAAKRARLLARYGRVTDSNKRRQIEPILLRLTDSTSVGDYSQANVDLNAAFEIMDASRPPKSRRPKKGKLEDLFADEPKKSKENSKGRKSRKGSLDDLFR